MSIEADDRTSPPRTVRRRSLIGLLAALGCLLGLLVVAAPTAGAAEAQRYTPCATIVIDPATVRAGGTVVITVSGLAPNSQAQFFHGNTLIGTAVADANGQAVLSYTIPPDTPPGAFVVRVVGVCERGDPADVSSEIAVRSPSATTVVTAAPLPKTGSDVGTFVRVGIVLVALGGVLVLTTRKRARAAGVDADG